MTRDFSYILVIFALFVLPFFLQRYRMPAAITSLFMGTLCSATFGWFHQDPTIGLLATLGISSLFLFAGMEIKIPDTKDEIKVILQHVFFSLILLLAVAWAASRILDLQPRAALLLGLALLTPSTGFILDSIQLLNLDESERYWIKSKAIAAEILALATLFFVLQSTSLIRFFSSSLALAAMILILPVIFAYYTRWISPYARGSEFGFLLMMAVLCAYITKKLGVYYLIGAFIVGTTVMRSKLSSPKLATEKMQDGIRMFASFFVPFYFFRAGLELPTAALSPLAIGMGIGFTIIFVPLRILWVALHRRLVLRESWKAGIRVGLSMVPTLVFTLVIAAILYERLGVSAELFGALAVYAVLNTLIPTMVLHMPIKTVDDAPYLMAFPSADLPEQ